MDTLTEIELRAKLASDTIAPDNLENVQTRFPSSYAAFDDKGRPFAAVIDSGRKGAVALCGPADDGQSRADALFFAHAKGDVLTLVDELRFAQAANRRLREENKGLSETIGLLRDATSKMIDSVSSALRVND